MAVLQARFELEQIFSDRRGAVRRKLYLEILAAGGSTSSEVVILDLSTTGLLLETSENLKIDERIDLDLPGSDAIEAIVRWQSGRFFGCQFSAPIPMGAVSAALLRAAPLPSDPELATGSEPALPAVPDRQMPIQGQISLQSRIGWLIGLSVLSWAAIVGAAILITSYYRRS